MVIAIVLGVFGFQATGWQAEAQTRMDCKTVLLPALRDLVRSKRVTPADLTEFARAHDLTLAVSTVRIPTYDSPRRTLSPTPTPSKSGTPTKKPSAGARP